MEVKGLPTRPEFEDPRPTSQQRTLSAIPSVQPPAYESEPVKVSVESGAKASGTPENLGRINQVINVVNYVNEATQSISELVNSIDGIVEQVVNRQDMTPQRREVLENEANQLAVEIQSTVKDLSASVKSFVPDEGDRVRSEIEERLGRALDIIFPPETSSLNVGAVKLSEREAIINTLANIARTRERVEALREAARESSEKVSEVLTAVDAVAAANLSAASASVRDVDMASRLAEEASLRIGKDPTSALQVVSHIPKAALQLLE